MLLVALLSECLSLGDRLVVLGTTGGTLQFNQLVQFEALALITKDRFRFAMRELLIVPSAADYLSKQVDISTIRSERKIQLHFDGTCVHNKPSFAGHSANVVFGRPLG